MKPAILFVLTLTVAKINLVQAKNNTCNELVGIWVGITDTKRNWQSEDNFTQFFLRISIKRNIVRVWTVEGSDYHLLEYGEAQSTGNRCIFRQPSKKNKYPGLLIFKQYAMPNFFTIEPPIYSPMTKGIFKAERHIEGIPQNIYELE